MGKCGVMAEIELICQKPTIPQLSGIHPSFGVRELGTHGVVSLCMMLLWHQWSVKYHLNSASELARKVLCRALTVPGHYTWNYFAPGIGQQINPPVMEDIM